MKSAAKGVGRPNVVRFHTSNVKFHLPVVVSILGVEYESGVRGPVIPQPEFGLTSTKAFRTPPSHRRRRIRHFQSRFSERRRSPFLGSTQTPTEASR